MGGLPKLEYTRSLSRYGLSQVTVVFKDGTDIYFARQLVNERIQQVQGPACRRASRPRWGRSRPASAKSSCTRSRPRPARASADGERLHADRPAHDPGLDHQAAAAHRARRHRGQHHRRLRASSSTCCPIPAQLMAYRLGFRDVMTALAANNANVGAGYIERNGEQYLVRTPGQVGNIDEIQRHRGRHRATACRCAIRDVAEVEEGTELRTGAATRERQGDRARHRHAADRREQPHRRAARRREARRRSRSRCPRASSRGRSTTAPVWSKRRSRPSRRTCSKARCW